MPDQTIAFTPYAAPDLTGLRAGQLVSHQDVLYDVKKVEVRETLGGRYDGNPIQIETRLDIHLQRARWIEEPRIPAFETPADVFVLPEVDGQRTTVINGQAYWLYSVMMNRVYPAFGATTAEQDVPESIELQLVRNPLEDPEIDVMCTCEKTPGVGELHEQSCPGFSADVERWAARQEANRG